MSAIVRFIVIVALVIVLLLVFVVGGIFTYNHYKGSDGTEASAANANGSSSVLPVIGSAQETAPVNTTGDPRTPATFAPFSKANQFVTTWSGLNSAVTGASAQWYRDAVNNRTASTRFSWMDIEYWANDPQLKGVSPLTIQVFGGSWSDVQARAIAAEIVGIDLAAKLPIVHHNSGLLVNTRSIGVHEVGDFLDLRKMVRVSLSPVVYDKDGKVIGLDGNSGIFADCLNIWRLAPPKVTPPKVTPPKVAPPSVTPPRFTPPRFTPPRFTPPTTQPPRFTPPTTQPPRITPPTTQPPRITPPTTQPPRITPPTTQPPRVTPKDPTQDPAPQGNAPVGGGRNQDPGPGTYIPPAQMQQPPAQPRVNPSPPTTLHVVTPPPPTGSTPDPTPPPPPEPQAPTPEAPATGTVTPPGM